METVVFLHGWGTGPKIFQPLIKSLGKNYHVIAPNLSDLTDNKEFTWKKFAENLDKFIGKRKIYLIGTSLGGGLALAYAALHPKKVKVVIACEPAGFKSRRNKIIWAFLLLWMTTRALSYPRGIRVVSKVRVSFLKETIFHFREVYTQAKLGLEKDLEKHLSKIKAPVHLLWSKNSGILPLWMGERVHQRITTSKFDPNFSDKNHLWCVFEQEKIAKMFFKILTDGKIGERGDLEIGKAANTL